MSSAQLDNPTSQPMYDHPIREMLKIAAPSIATMTSYTVMQFVDGKMVSEITPASPVYLSAQANAGMLVWLSLSFALGTMGVVNTYVSQNFGAGTPARGARYAWSVMWMAIAWSLLLVPVAVLLPSIFAHMDHAPELVALETQYARINIYGAFFVLMSRGIAHYFYGMHKPGVVLIAAVCANLTNLSINALLIYGSAGPPESFPLHSLFASIASSLGIAPLGVTGAAIGTVIGSAVEMSIPLMVFLSPWMHRRYATRTGWQLSPAHIRDIFKLGWPAGLMFVNEMLCWTYLMAVLVPAGGAAKARLQLASTLDSASATQMIEQARTIANTAGWIGLRYMHLSFMPAVGMSIAVSAIVGKYMGMGKSHIANHRAWIGLRLTVLYMGLCALAFVLFRRRLVEFFIDPRMDPAQAQQLLDAGMAVMVAAAVFQVFDAVAITISGALRGAGDTVWPGVVTIILSWTCIIGVGHALLYLAPQLGLMGPWIGASAYIMLLGIVFMIRFVAGKWKQINVLGESATMPGTTDLPAPTDAIASGLPGEA